MISEEPGGFLDPEELIKFMAETLHEPEPQYPPPVKYWVADTWPPGGGRVGIWLPNTEAFPN